MSLRAHISEYAAGFASLMIATVGVAGPTWQTIAVATTTILFSIAVGAGGFFVSQQVARDTRQDLLLDAMTKQLVEVSMNMVKVTVATNEARELAVSERSIREARDQRELEAFRRKAEAKK